MTGLVGRADAFPTPIPPLRVRARVPAHALRTLALVAAVALPLALPLVVRDTTRLPPPPHQAARLGTEAETLPLALQSTISAVLGRDDRAYAALPTRGGFWIANARHRLSATLTAPGVEVLTAEGRLRLALEGLGYGERLAPLTPVVPTARANRVSYRYGSLVEWYVNGPLGLEQGFTLDARPIVRGDGPLTLSLAVDGSLRPVAAGERELHFVGSSLRYRGLFAVDATGRELRTWLELEPGRLLVRVDDRGARYPLLVDPFIQDAKLAASDGAATDALGRAVAVASDTVVAGAPSADIGGRTNQGAVYVFERTAAGWPTSETAKLVAADGAAEDRLGADVAVGVTAAGITVAAGAPSADIAGNPGQGAVYVFERTAAGWPATDTAKLTSSDGAAGDDLGASVATTGDTIVAGAPFGEAAYVFERTASGWPVVETRKFTASDNLGGDFFGTSVAIGGDAIAAGARHARVGGQEPGAVYVFEKSGGAWPASETAKLSASDSGSGSVRELGVSVALSASGRTVVAGAFRTDVGANEAQGAAYVFERASAGWAEVAKLTASDGRAFDDFGLAVAVAGDGETAFAGSYFADVGGAARGAVYVFERTAAGWPATETAKLTAGDGAAGDLLGFSVAVAGDVLAAGAPGAAIGGNASQGAVYVFGGVSDSDGDGIPDRADPDTVAAILAGLDDSAFAGPGHRTALLSRLDDAEALIARWYATGDTTARDEAIRLLENLLRRTDGCGAGPDRDDWVTDCAAQGALRSAVQTVIDALLAP